MSKTQSISFNERVYEELENERGVTPRSTYVNHILGKYFKIEKTK